MKDKKGFTLIELLAVIVILAIIALIAVPIILNMINNARKSAAVDAAYGYVEAIEHNAGLSDLEVNGYDIDIPDGTYTVSQINSKNIKIKGKKPTKGNVTLATRKVSHARLAIDGYWVEYNGKEAEVTGKYTPGKATITFKNGETTVDTRQVNEGSTIGSFPNITLEENETLVGWYSESTFTNKVETTTEVNDDMTVYVKINRPRTCEEFVSDSWSTIAQNTYPVGCEKEVAIGSNSYTVRIANTSTPEVCSTTGYSQTACGFVIEFVDIVEKRLMNATVTNAGGWKETEMVTYLNSDFYNSLPSDLRNVIIPTYPIVSGSGKVNTNIENSGVSENITATDTTKNKIYLLSAREVGFNMSGDNKRNTTTDTRILDYYSTHNNNNSRIKKDLNNAAIQWWLRSATSSSTGYFYRVMDNGGGDTNTYDTYGVAPAFRIGTN